MPGASHGTASIKFEGLWQGEPPRIFAYHPGKAEVILIGRANDEATMERMVETVRAELPFENTYVSSRTGETTFTSLTTIRATRATPADLEALICWPDPLKRRGLLKGEMEY